MKILKWVLLLLLYTVSAVSGAEERERLILLPVQAEGSSADERESYRIAMQQRLSERYTVFSGAAVEQKLKQEMKKTCNDTECLQEVAIAFQGSLMARLTITPQSSGYLIGLEIKNILTDSVVESISEPCAGCDALQVNSRLAQLNFQMSDDEFWLQARMKDTPESYQGYLSRFPAGKHQTEASLAMESLLAKQAAARQREQNPKPKESGGINWLYVGLGVLVVGGLAAAAGGGGSSSSSTAATSTTTGTAPTPATSSSQGQIGVSW